MNVNENILKEYQAKIFTRPRICIKPFGKKFICIAPHPDDEIIGCGGSLLKHIDYKDTVYILYLSVGRNSKEYSIRLRELTEGLKIIGINSYYILSGTFEQKVLMMAQYINEIQPDGIYIPHLLDRNMEHFEANIILECALNKCKKTDKLSIIGYEVWNTLQATNVVNISDYYKLKIEALNKHVSQCEKYTYVHMVETLDKYRLLSNHPDNKTIEIVHKESKYRRLEKKKYVLPWKYMEAFRILSIKEYEEEFQRLKNEKSFNGDF